MHRGSPRRKMNGGEPSWMIEILGAYLVPMLRKAR
jgi:hypothetical protein